MKLIKLIPKNSLKSLFLLTICISLLTNINAKMRHKLKKHKQVILERPIASSTVVSPIVEADALPSHSTININIPQRTGVQVFPPLITSLNRAIPLSTGTFSVPVMRNLNQPLSRDLIPNYTTPIFKPSFSPVLNQFNGNDNDIRVHDQNFQMNLHPQNNLASHINQIISNRGIINNNLNQNFNQNFQKTQIHDKNPSLNEQDLELIDPSNDNKNENEINDTISPKSQTDDDIISLEPKKKILRLDSKNNNSSSSVHKSDETLLKDLITWAKLHKVQMKRLKLNSHSKHTGESNIKSGEKIHKNEKVLDIPRDLIIDPNNPNLKTLCSRIKRIRFFKNNFDKICMTVYLLINTDESIQPFIDFMNENTIFSSFPFFYNKKQLSLLKGSYFASLIAGREESMNFEYKILTEDKILPSIVTKEDYFKARVNVMSKNFRLIDPQGLPVSVIVPFADLLNHDASKANVRLYMKKEGVQVRALANIKKNEPIYSSYGVTSNYHYLLYYGFVEENNQIALPINLDLRVRNGSGERKNEEVMLQANFEMNLTLEKFRRIVSDFNVDVKMSKKRQNFENFEKNQKNEFSKFISPISLENETESLRLLKIGLKKQLSRYSSKLQDDIKKLENSNVDRNTRNILTVLIEEKKIIIKYYNAALIFYKMLKKVSELNEEKSNENENISSNNSNNSNNTLILTTKISKLIKKRKYYRNYFNILKEKFKLKIELNEMNETEGQGINIDIDSEYQNEGSDENLEISDPDGNSVMMQDESNHSFGSFNENENFGYEDYSQHQHQYQYDISNNLQNDLQSNFNPNGNNGVINLSNQGTEIQIGQELINQNNHMNSNDNSSNILNSQKISSMPIDNTKNNDGNAYQIENKLPHVNLRR
jgi:hypothetical protein